MVVATGFFDGVHLGHRKVLEALVAEARARRTESIVVTFWPHPRNVLQNDARGLRLLTSQREKEKLILACGVDRVEVIEFTREFSQLSAEKYFRQYVKWRYGADALVLGWDNRIGFNSGSTEEVARLAADMGLDVIRTEPVCYEGSQISSTRIRNVLSEGDVAAASAMLGYDYSLRGVVVEGDKIGRTMGFPTANMQMYDPLKLVPASGVYLTKVSTLGSEFYGVTNIGTRPTVTGVSQGDALSEKIRTVETNIFDFNEEIYGLDISISFMARIREERRFPSLDALRTQIELDRAHCLSLLSA